MSAKGIFVFRQLLICADTPIETAKEMFIEFRELMSQLLDDEQIVFEEEFEKMMREDLEFVSFVSQKVTDAVEEWKKEKYEKN